MTVKIIIIHSEDVAGFAVFIHICCHFQSHSQFVSPAAGVGTICRCVLNNWII